MIPNEPTRSLINELTISHHKIGTSIGTARLSLHKYLYRGSTQTKAPDAIRLIASNKLGDPQLDRVELLKAIKAELEGKLSKGDSVESTKVYLGLIRNFLKDSESNGFSYQLTDLPEAYIRYCDGLLNKALLNKKKSSKETAYGYAITLSALFSSILELPDEEPLINLTRIKAFRKKSRRKFKDTQKQNLQISFKFGNFLTDLVKGLSIEAISGTLPLRIPIRDGLVPGNEIYLDGGVSKTGLSNTPVSTPQQRHRHKKKQLLRAPTTQLSGRGGAGRCRLVNLRLQAEILIFLAQTGMNLTQAIDMKKSVYKFKTDGDSWEVRDYKNRKAGEVEFKIFKAYKPFFNDLKKFTQHYFPQSNFFFPLFGKTGAIETSTRVGYRQFNLIKDLCANYGISWVSPRIIRSTRINWIYRRSGDTDITAEIAQHGKKTLKQNYLIPNQQRAMTEITRFWHEHDPLKKEGLNATLIGSICNGVPQALDDKPEAVVMPNCETPSGCLWCQHHRDVDSEDYVWSLASLREIKIIEASKLLTPNKAPSDYVIDRISAKLEWFQKAGEERNAWVTEAFAKINEGDFHPNWAHILRYFN
jgi:hypothetical protein